MIEDSEGSRRTRASSRIQASFIRQAQQLVAKKSSANSSSNYQASNSGGGSQNYVPPRELCENFKNLLMGRSRPSVSRRTYCGKTFATADERKTHVEVGDANPQGLTHQE